ncbi:Voltage-dependent T-type calcium channel subunit alpha-1G (Cav3.1c) (NBR13) (Voltage-gated calcium channel subunit alpha Cav3.1) [Durusdinium trenchii]|uniref:Voltage-dependent T-type calcium channel subunit alpha-1G (Cav3.1c) (NBR13) (Voltage-gated calcium channel subunit alpha Cav3.1) n=1 Tax=Durusdinium trenchii TaxID=1381693 RepID=A0ABP0PTX6_9DINO
MAMASGLSLATSRQVTHHSFAQSFQRPFLRMQKTRRLSNLSRQLLASAAGVGAYGACHAMRQRRSFAVACAAEEATAPEAFPPAVIVGGGRLGEAFAKMGLRQDVIVRRGETFPSDAPEGPIYVCTRNDALEEVIRMVPEERHEETQPDVGGEKGEEALLAKLEGELHKLSIRHASPIVKVSPDASHDHSEEVSEADEGNAPQKLPKFLGFGRTGTKAFAANAGGEASMSTASKMMKGDESDTHHHHYSINGIDGKERSMVRNTLTSLIKSNFATGDNQCSCAARCSRAFVSCLVAWEKCLTWEEPPRHGCLHRFVNSTTFGMVSGAVILLNAIFIFYTTDLEMQNIETPFDLDPRVQIAEVLLASFYVVELVLKLMVHRLFFFWNSEMSWNCFDFMLVVFSIFENLFTFLAFNTGDVAEESTGSGVNLAFLRLVRLCRIVKILRVFRTLKFFSELRLMLDCVLGSLMNVMWCVIMLVFVMYVFALLLQQGIVEHLTLVHARQDGTDVEQLTTYFGSVGSTVVTLFQASTSGVDWNEPYQALRKTGMVMPMAFLGYVAFVFISVWNIVTSIFVEKALKLAMPDADMVIVEHQLQDAQDHKMLTKLFKSKSKSSDGIEQRLGLEEFRKLVETYEFRSYLQSRGIDIKNAETFFRMLVELQGETTIDATTFANACVRMKGAATSIDLQTVMFTTHLMNREQRKSFESLYSSLANIEASIDAQNVQVKMPGLPVTILLVYFAVAKKGEPPLDGKTDTDPEGLSAVNAGGKWAREVHWRLTSSDLACRILRDMEFKQAYWEKNLWISAYMMVGALHGCTVGEVESTHRKEVDELIGQLAVAVSASQADVTWERLLLCDRLAAYARSVAHFPTAVKEFEWRNGAFYEMSKAAEAAGRPDPCLKHTEGLRTLKVI